ncbi:MAG: Dabb family protein [Verrucomicrobiae bacterium]|nr:Dabb family protein [Verrucomicrobiae bacterium]MCP5550537.1 Dabb family protein [Akkermansiaceae bacterium]
MVRHSVYFWLDESLTGEQKQQFEGGLRALFDIDVVRRGDFGAAAGTPERPVTNNSYDYALFLEFDNVEDHNTYQSHPDHDVFVENFSPWFKTVKVFDTEL